MRGVWVPPLVATAVLGLLALVWFSMTVVHERNVIGEDIRTALAENGQVDVVVTIDFEPERLHASFFRELAPVGGRVRGRQFFLSRLDESQLRRIGRKLWVGSVELWDRDSPT